jgi:CRP-like cAMP-binding protein
MASEFQLLIAHIQRHVMLTDEEKTAFTAFFKLKSLKAGEFLLRRGEVCKCESFVVRGCLKAYHEDADGVEHVLDFLIEEWWADDLYSFLTQKPSPSSVRAIEDTEVLQIGKNELETLYQKIPRFERFFRLLFQNAFISQREQINQILSATAEERYREFLKKKPYALARFPQKDIASYLGVTPQFFSSLKKKMDGLM